MEGRTWPFRLDLDALDHGRPHPVEGSPDRSAAAPTALLYHIIEHAFFLRLRCVDHAAEDQRAAGPAAVFDLDCLLRTEPFIQRMREQTSQPGPPRDLCRLAWSKSAQLREGDRNEQRY